MIFFSDSTEASFVECHSQRRPLTDKNARVIEIPTVSTCYSAEEKNVATDEVNKGLLHYRNFGNINRSIIFISFIKPKTFSVICKTKFSDIHWNLTTKGKGKRIQSTLYGQMSMVYSTSLAFIFNHASFSLPLLFHSYSCRF